MLQRVIYIVSITVLILSNVLSAGPRSWGIEFLKKCGLYHLGHATTKIPDPRNPPSKYLNDKGDIILPVSEFGLSPKTLMTAIKYGYLPYFTHMAEKPTLQYDHLAVGRGVLHIPTTINKIRKERAKAIKEAMENYGYRITFDKAFRQVVSSCANMTRYVKSRFDPKNTKDPNYPTQEVLNKYPDALAQGWYWKEDENGDRVVRGTTWLIDEMIQGFIGLRSLQNAYRQGATFSVEVWNKQGELVGGTFGTIFDSVYTGWSLFYDSQPLPGTNKAKGDYAGMVAIFAVLDHLDRLGYEWMDAEESTKGNLTHNIGGKELTRDAFLNLMEQEREKKISFSLPTGEYSLKHLYALPVPTSDQMTIMMAPGGIVEYLKKLAYSKGKFIRLPLEYGQDKQERIWQPKEILLQLLSEMKSRGISDEKLLSAKNRIQNLGRTSKESAGWQKDDGRRLFQSQDPEILTRIVQALFLIEDTLGKSAQFDGDYYNGASVFSRLGWHAVD